VETGDATRIFGLDIFRALAIFIVMFAHSSVLFTNFPMIIRKLLFFVPAHIGVDLFFVLSGFLIGSIIIKLVDSGKDFTLSTIKYFWIRRWFRTLPNYYLVLLSQLILVYVLLARIPLDLLHFFSFTQNFASKQPPFFNEAWSLSVEEWFYFFFPLAMLGCKSLIPNISTKATFLIVVSFFLISSLAARIIATLFFPMSLAKGMHAVVIFRMDSIMFGVLFAYLYYYFKLSMERYRKILFSVGLLLIILCVGNRVYNIINNTEGFFVRTLYFSFCSFGMACLLPSFISIKKEGSSTISRVITHLSIISYSVYLIHNSIVFPIIHTEKPIMGNYVVNYFLFWLLTIIASTALYNIYEKPMMSLREKFAGNLPKRE
jgi:peptidoglycan/LPS O-acetylase OafA/YrhL